MAGNQQIIVGVARLKGTGSGALWRDLLDGLVRVSPQTGQTEEQEAHEF